GLAGVAVGYFQQAGTGHRYPGLVALAIAMLVGLVIGLIQGSVIAFIGVPSFGVTLAGLLVSQGLILQVIGTQGVIGIQDKQLNDISNYVLTKNTGWIVAIILTVALAAASFGSYISRLRAGLPTGNLFLTVVRVAFLGGLAFAAVYVCNQAKPRPGLPLVGLIVVFFVVLGGYVASRTTFGRHVYAVGGNAEAARRAGIDVKLIRILVFMISGGMAAMGGVILASRLNGIDLTAGGGSLLLDSISAAVIGGVSLFGGRGRVSGALFGGLIIGMVANGIDLLGYSDAIKYITTGTILLAAVTLDTVLRRPQAAAPRAYHLVRWLDADERRGPRESRLCAQQRISQHQRICDRRREARTACGFEAAVERGRGGRRADRVQPRWQDAGRHRAWNEQHQRLRGRRTRLRRRPHNDPFGGANAVRLRLHRGRCPRRHRGIRRGHRQGRGVLVRGRGARRAEARQRLGRRHAQRGLLGGRDQGRPLPLRHELRRRHDLELRHRRRRWHRARGA